MQIKLIVVVVVEVRKGVVGGGEGGRSQKTFFVPFGSQFGLKISGRPGPLPCVRHCSL